MNFKKLSYFRGGLTEVTPRKCPLTSMGKLPKNVPQRNYLVLKLGVIYIIRDDKYLKIKIPSY